MGKVKLWKSAGKAKRLLSSTDFLVLAVPLVIYFLCLNGVWASDHPSSLLDLDYALYAHHTFALGRAGGSSPFVPNSVDVFSYHGRWYTASAPGTAILAFPFAALGFYIEGGFTVFGWVMILSEAFVALANAFAVFVLYRILRDFFACEECIAGFVAFAYAFSTISWPFATYFFQSDVSSLFVLLGVYFALNSAAIRRKTTANASGPSRLLTPTSSALICGLSLGVALTVDYVTAALVPIFLVYVAFSRRGVIFDRVRRVTTLMAGWGAGLVFLLYYNFLSFGNAFTTSEQLYLGRSGPLSSFSFPLQAGLLLNFFTPLRGILLYSPILAAGVWGLFVCFRRGKPGSANINSWRLSLVFILALFVGIVVPYSMWYSVTAGISYGPRFLIPAMPLILIPFGAAIEGLGKSKRAAALAFGLFAVGVIVNGLGALTGAVPPDRAWLSSPFLHDVLPDLTRNQLDTWWIARLGLYWPALAVPILITPLMFAVNFLRGLTRLTRETPTPNSRLGLGHIQADCEMRSREMDKV